MGPYWGSGTHTSTHGRATRPGIDVDYPIYLPNTPYKPPADASGGWPRAAPALDPGSRGRDPGQPPGQSK